MSHELQPAADAVLRRARQEGHVVARQVRAALKALGFAPTRWKEVIALAGPELRQRAGRFHHIHAQNERARHERDQKRVVHKAVRQMVHEYRSAARKADRREQTRVPFIQPVHVRAEDGSEFTLLARDVSSTGIRLVGTRRLLGKKIWVTVAAPEKLLMPGMPRAGSGWTFLVRVLWTCAVADDLFENGGAFVEVVPVATSDS